jgi:MFS family permease
MVAPMILGGLGTGVTLPSLTGVVMSKVAPPQAGVASGVLTTAQQFAQTIGVAVLGVIFFSALGASLDKVGYVHALTVISVLGIVLSMATLIGTFFLPRGPMRPPAAARPPADAGATPVGRLAGAVAVKEPQQ